MPDLLSPHQDGASRQVRQVVEAHTARYARDTVLLVSATVRHALGDDLRRVRRGVSSAWRRVRQGRAWPDWCGAVGYVGDVRAMEVTHGQHGWHPHLHSVLLFTRAPTAAEIQWLRDRWAACVEAELGAEHRPDDEHGLDARPAHDADYITKLGLEVTDAVSTKSAKNGNRTPLRIAEDYVRYGRDGDATLWRAYCDGMRGARMLTWTRGLRERYGLGQDEPDAALADDAAPEAEPVLMALIPARAWDALRSLPGARAAILEAAEAGSEALAATLGLPDHRPLSTHGRVGTGPPEATRVGVC